MAAGGARAICWSSFQHTLTQEIVGMYKSGSYTFNYTTSPNQPSANQAKNLTIARINIWSWLDWANKSALHFLAHPAQSLDIDSL